MLRRVFDYLLVSIVSVFLPVTPIIVSIMMLIVVDMIFGIYAAIKRKNKITSRKMSQTISKLLLYVLVILSVHLLDTYILKSSFELTKVCAGLLGIIEIKSIDENWAKIFGYSLWDKIKGMVKRADNTELL